MIGIKIFLLFVVVFVAAGLALWQYNWGKHQPNWLLLAGLRFITYLGLGILLLDPKINHKDVSLEKPILVLAVDNSKSISHFQAETDLLSAVNRLKDNPKINDKFKVDAYRFGAEFNVLGDSLDFAEPQTDIDAVFKNLTSIYKSSRPAVVLLSDGNQTRGRDYEQSAQDFEGSIATVVVGDTTTFDDLKISRINTNKYSFLENEFPVEVFVNYDGAKPIEPELTIREGKHTLFRKRLNLSKQHKAEVVKAKLQSQSVGVHTYTAVITPLTDEKTTENNTSNFAVEVIDQKSKILILSSLPHPDLGTFKKSIESNQQQHVDIKFTNDENIEFFDYQLVILYQPTAKFELYYDRISKIGLNTLTVTGTQTDYEFLNSIQSDFQKEITNTTEYYTPIYNAAYERFQFEDIGFSEFPPLRDKFGDIELKSEYNTLLFESIDGFEAETPLLLTTEKANRKQGYLFGENTWQWRAKVYRDRESFEEYDNFFNGIIQYLTSNKKRDRLEVSYETFYNTGDEILLQAYYYDENYQLDLRGKLKAEITQKETDDKQSYPFVLRQNRYELDLSELEAGEYHFETTVDGDNISRSGEFTIIDYDIESQFVRADYDKLKRISGESTYLLTEIDQLIENLLSDDTFKTIQKIKRKQSSLIDWKYLCFIIALALGIEWFIRKYRGLI